jgi:hypothetical protein
MLFNEQSQQQRILIFSFLTSPMEANFMKEFEAKEDARPIIEVIQEDEEAEKRLQELMAESVQEVAKMRNSPEEYFASKGPQLECRNPFCDAKFFTDEERGHHEVNTCPCSNKAKKTKTRTKKTEKKKKAEKMLRKLEKLFESRDIVAYLNSWSNPVAICGMSVTKQHILFQRLNKKKRTTESLHIDNFTKRLKSRPSQNNAASATPSALSPIHKMQM